MERRDVDCESDVFTWTMQEVVSDPLENYKIDIRPPHTKSRADDPIRNHIMEGKKIHKKKKKCATCVALNGHSSSLEPPSGNKTSYGLGLSRGFSLWRTLKEIRHCITKVSNPMTKSQRRSLRRKLSYYVDDLERIVVGVNPRAPVTEAEDSVSGDEEMREEVNALIEDALDEAALQGKVLHSDYFETRMTYVDKKYTDLKERLEELAARIGQDKKPNNLMLLNGEAEPATADIDVDDANDAMSQPQKRRASSNSPAVINHNSDTSTDSNSTDSNSTDDFSTNKAKWTHPTPDDGTREFSKVCGITKEPRQKTDDLICERNTDETNNKPVNGRRNTDNPRGKTRGRKRHVPAVRLLRFNQK